jgi:D-serine deaminase-like pyridoxal phosphate-dependent protein
MSHERLDLDHDRSLIGVPDGRWAIATPALVIDLDRVEANLAYMADFAARHNIKLRPHAKTHKSVKLAARQRALGAIGICTARIGEAEALAEGGIDDILITAPIISAQAIDRLAVLAMRNAGTKIVVDHIDGARALNDCAHSSDQIIDVLIDLDIGLHRTGLSPDQAALDLADLIAQMPNLNLVGVQAYAGHLMHVQNWDERKEKLQAALTPVQNLIPLLRDQGHKIDIITGGGTGSFKIDVEIGLFTELQVGSYLFMDVDYLAIDPGDQSAWPLQPALFVQSCVISANAPGLVTLDAGLKAFATDGPMPRVFEGADPNLRYRFMGDEQGALIRDEDAPLPKLGDVVNLTIPHCDPTVNLYDFYHVVRGHTLIDLWPIEGRGRGR